MQNALMNIYAFYLLKQNLTIGLEQRSGYISAYHL